MAGRGERRLGGERETDPDLESHRLVWLGVMGECLGDKIGSNGRTEYCRKVARDKLYEYKFAKGDSDEQPINCAHLATEARLSHSRVPNDHDLDCTHVG